MPVIGPVLDGTAPNYIDGARDATSISLGPLQRSENVRLSAKARESETAENMSCLSLSGILFLTIS
jgi:hypothetical protein